MKEAKDILTGLDRYEEFLRKLDEEIRKLDDYRIAIVYTDIKHFKYINDTLGYQRGDMLLKEFVNQVTKDNSHMLCAARVVSDNIVLAVRLENSVSNDDFREFIHQCNREMEDKFREEYLAARLKFCTGISFIEKNDRSLDPATAVSNANLARKMAKEMKDDCCVVFDHRMVEGIKKEVEITSSLSKAIANGELKVYYQPKMETGSLRME
ncbi:MAG: diguanylate cyclase [Lachnospiraceae bacterium]|nr:diguanylate cyclase [Lachnospiraceae bacterium]